MAVAVERTAHRYFDIVAGVAIDVDFPISQASDVRVIYGIDANTAVLNVDYTIQELGAPGFFLFKVTPLNALLEKINLLIAENPDELNAITVRRIKNYLTSATPDFAKNPTWISREFDATAQRFQQLQERLNRAIVLGDSFVGDNPQLVINQLVPGTVLMVNDDGDAIVAGPNATDISNAEANAAIALQAAADAAAALATAQQVLTDVQAIMSAFGVQATSVAAWAMRKALAAQSQATYYLVQDNIPADPVNAVNIAWTTGAWITPGDTLYAAIQTSLGYSSGQMNTLMQLARTQTL